MKKLVCGIFGTIYYATILKDGLMSATDRKDVTIEAITAVAEHFRTMSENMCWYEVNLSYNKIYHLAFYDPEKYMLVEKEVTE